MEIAQKLKSLPEVEQNISAYMAYCGFLKSAGLYKSLLQSVIERIKKDQAIPWFYLFLVVDKYQLEVDLAQLAHLFSEKSSDSDWDFLMTSSCLAEHHWVNTRNQYLQQFYEDSQDPQIVMEKELAFIRSQGLVRKEEELLKQLLELDEKNPFFKNEYMECQRKKAYQTFSEYKNSSSSQSHRSAAIYQNKEERQAIDHLLSHLKGKGSLMIDDLTILLSSTGYAGAAIEFLQSHLETSSRQWLYLDLLLESGQYLRCLTFIEQLFLECNPDSETAFSLVYIKARAYYGLKEYNKAKKLLEGLISACPQHHLAKTLLLNWESAEEM